MPGKRGDRHTKVLGAQDSRCLVAGGADASSGCERRLVNQSTSARSAAQVSLDFCQAVCRGPCRPLPLANKGADAQQVAISA